MTSLDLNADIGEGLPNDAALLEIISSASIACGGHAGDETTIRAALANMAAEDEVIASVAFAAVRNQNPGLAILAIDNSAQVSAAEALGMTVVHEAYADRAYQPNGLLVPRSEPGAVLHNAELIAQRAVRLAMRGELVTSEGTPLASVARSLCIHGDNAEAVAIAHALREALAEAGIEIAPAL